MAAAAAAAFCPGASVDSILNAAVEYLPRRSAKVMLDFIEATLALARETGAYETFRERCYAGRILPGIAMPDARETVPAALSLFYLANGDPRQTILYGANFGRDADTIASMAGSLAGALHGASALPGEWVEKIRVSGRRDQSALTAMLVEVIHRRAADMARVIEGIEGLGETAASAGGFHQRPQRGFLVLPFQIWITPPVWTPAASPSNSGTSSIP